MTDKEAKYAKEILQSGFYIGGTDTEKTIKIALEALEKQIPMNPDEVLCGDGFAIAVCCPSCGYDTFGGNHDKFCCNCGQKIDWSENR